MASQPGSLTITIYILANISQSKCNQTMKFGQLIEYNKANFLLRNYALNLTGRLVLGLFVF